MRYASLRLVRGLSAAVLAALAAGAPRAGGDDPWKPTGEVFRTPLEGTGLAVVRDEATGRKALLAPDGTRHEGVEAAVRAEAAGRPRAELVVDPRLRAAAADPERRDVPVVVNLVLGRQPAHEAGTAARLRHGPRFEEILGEMRTILSRVGPSRAADPGRALQLGDRVEEERRLLSADERARLRALRDEGRALLRALRREVLDEAKAAAALDQAPLVSWLESRADARVLSRGTVLSRVTALLPPRAIGEAVERFPGLHRVLPLEVLETGLDVSVPTCGASSWTSNGYDGSSTTKVAVIDTGIDSGHPAFSGGIVSDAAVFLAVASQQSNFADNASSVDDFQFHGTHVGGIVSSNDSTYKGVAPGGRLMNAKAGYLTTSGGGSLTDPDIMDAGDWAADNGADAFNCSFGGGGTTNGNSALALFFDAMAHDLNVPSAISSGNSGPSSGTCLSPGDAFNVVTVGNFDDNGTTTHTDNFLASSSSRGPTSDGRRKPDLSAPGSLIASCYAFWESSSDFVSATGTSMSAPHVAGALGILEDYLSSWTPEGTKALLLTNCRNASPYPASPDSAWGHGGMDLAAAYANRACVREASLSSSGTAYAFALAPSLASGGRVTLCWNRQVVSNNDSAPSTYYTILDLDLLVYDRTTGSSLGSSASTVNSVEQVKLGSAATTPVVKVRRNSSFPSGVTTQDFALGAEATTAFTSVNPPSLSCSFTQAPTLTGPSADFTVSVQAANGGGLSAFAPSVTLSLPAGYSVQSGANPQVLSTIAAGGNGTATWTVRSASSGATGNRTFQATASSSSFGETFASSAASSTHSFDAAGPSGGVTAASGAAWTASSTVPLSLSATDDLAGVTEMRFGNDGSTWSSWEAYGTSKSWGLAAGADGARTVHAQFRDAVGNVSSDATDAIGLDTTGPSGSLSVNGGASWTSSASVTLSPSASDAGAGGIEMSFSNDGTTWGGWQALAGSASWALAGGADGARTVHARFRDALGNVSAANATDAIGLDATGPSGSVSIDGGATFATGTGVTLSLAATDALSGVAEMRFSNDGTTWGAWQAYGATASWTLLAGEGARTVFAQFRDAAGNASSPSGASDGIVLDGTAPSGSILVAGGLPWTSVQGVVLSLFATDPGSGVASMRFSDDGSAWSAWEPYGLAKAWTLPATDGMKTVYVQFRDGAGNVSTSSDGIGLDATGPLGSVTVAGGAAYANAATVTVAVSTVDNLSGTVSMRFRNEAGPWSAWVPVTTLSSWTLSPGDGTKTVGAQFLDAAGNVSAVPTDSVVLDGTPPSGVVSVLGGRAAVNATAVTLDLLWTDNLSGVTDVRCSNDGTTWSSWTAAAASLPWTLAAGEGAKTVSVQFRDAAGNSSATASDGVLLDLTAPTAAMDFDALGEFVTPAEAFAAAVTADDGAGGSGPVEFRWSHDGGTLWSAWTAIGGGTVPVDRPSRRGRVLVTGEVRDAAGNVSAPVSASTFLLEDVPMDLSAVKKVGGVLAASGDLDPFTVDLMAGDLLTVTAKTKAPVKGLEVLADLRLLDPTGAEVVAGRFPAGGPKPGIKKFPAPATGTYLLVLGAAGADAVQGGTWTLGVKVKASKPARLFEGQSADGTIPFAAARNSFLTGTVTGAFAAPVSLADPDGGLVAATAADKGGKRVLAPALLAGPTGTWVLATGSAQPVTYRLVVKPAKRIPAVEGFDLSRP